MINWRLFFVSTIYTLLVVFTLDYYGAPWWIRAGFAVVTVLAIRTAYILGRIEKLDRKAELILRSLARYSAPSAPHPVVEEAPDDV